ncbi:MAG: substrate-binding domain-containing protein [Clostridiaceae bacterium]|nr:substrate-binding domain-containing protein [Clostridiaceae bacterium]
MGRRFRIGFVDEDTYDEYHNLLTKGILDSACQNNMDIIRFSHFHYQVTSSNPYHESVYIGLIRQFRLDGLIFLGWERTAYNSSFFESMKDIPMVSVGVRFDNVAGVYFRGQIYVAEIIRHLINVHGMKKIAFIAPIRPDDRTDAYFEVMDSYGMYDPRLFISHEELSGLDQSERGRRAVGILLDERGLCPEAIVSLYNEETFQIVNELQRRGLRVPDDIAVTSYEDGETGRFSMPAFTTVYFPWKELGFHACEVMNALLTKGEVPLETIVPGNLIYRSSCGCIPQSAISMETGSIPYSDIRFEDLDEDGLKRIINGIAEMTPFDAAEAGALMDSFREAFYKGEHSSFLMKFEMMLRKVRFYDEFREFKHITVVFRKLLMPYFLPYAGVSMEKPVWADNMFHQMQVILQDRLANAWFRKDVEYNKQKLALREAGKVLLTSFSVESLFATLEANLPGLGIDNCWLYLFNDREGTDIPDDFRPEFIFRDGSRAADQRLYDKSGPLCLEDIWFDDDTPHFLMSHLLYQGDQFLGFCVFETGLMDVRIIRSLSILISIALNSTILFEKLDQSYRKLMEKAHKKGMSDTTAILHNIANIMNSINVTYQGLAGIIEGSCVYDLKRANEMLEGKFEQLDDFIRNDPKGRLLMQYYLSFGDSFRQLQSRLKEYASRMLDKTGLIEDIINSQQSFEGIRSNLELMDIIPVLEDALKMSRNIIDTSGVQVVKRYDRQVKALAQRTKLIHILINIIKNAVESMQHGNASDKVLTIEVTCDRESVYLRICDTGPGIEAGKLESIFAYGFTTKTTGHGFGLHSCANYMAEMKGRIWAEKPETGTGAVFVMQFRSQPSL